MRGEYYTLTRWSSRGFRHRGFPSQFYGNGHSGAWGPRLVGAAPAPPPPDRPVSTSAAGGHTTVCRRPSRRHTPPASSSCLWFIPARTVHLNRAVLGAHGRIDIANLLLLYIKVKWHACPTGGQRAWQKPPRQPSIVMPDSCCPSGYTQMSLVEHLCSERFVHSPSH